MVPGQRAGSGKAAAGFRSPRPSAAGLEGGLVGRGAGSEGAEYKETDLSGIGYSADRRMTDRRLAASRG